jgi:hypothetical protein
MKTYKDTYTYVLNKMKVENYYSEDKNIGNIGSIFNAAEVHDITKNLLRTRAVNMDKTEWFDGKKDLKVIAMVPTRIMDLDNTIDFGDGKVRVDSQKIRIEYENFLRLVAKDENYQSKIISQIDNDADIVKAVQGDLEDNGPYTDIFKKYLKDKDIYIKEEVKDETKDGVTTETTKIKEDKDAPTKFKVSLTKDGSPGVELNGKVYKIRDNLEYLKSIEDADLQKAISDALNEYTGMKKAPHAPSKYLPTTTGARGKKVKKINPAWQKIQDLEKSLTAVKPKKIIKKKIR